MELKEKRNIWLKMWQYLYGDYYKKPIGLCSLFWGGLSGSFIFILAFFPFGFGKMIYNKINGFELFENGDGAFVGFVCNLFILLLWAGGFSIIIGEEGTGNFWLALLLGPFVVPSIIALLFGLVYLGVKALDKWRDAEPNENIQVLTEGVSSFWNKVCPRINWK